MATDHELENHGKLVELKTLFGGLQRDVQKIELKQDAQTVAIDAVNNNLVRLENTIERKRAYQKGVIAATTVAGGSVGAKIASLLGWLS